MEWLQVAVHTCMRHVVLALPRLVCLHASAHVQRALVVVIHTVAGAAP